MSDKITTLHLKNDPTTNIYPNVKIENIPLDVTIARGGSNLVTSGTIYDFANANFLSLDGGTMDGQIRINGIGIPEKTILGDGVEVVEESNPAKPVTHYGCGYIRQDDDEDSSIKYEYHFPKKSGTFALTKDLENYATKEEFEELKSLVYGIHALTYNTYEFANLTTSSIPDEVDDRKVVSGSYAIIDWVGGNSIVSDGEIKSTILSKIESYGANLFDKNTEVGTLSGWNNTEPRNFENGKYYLGMTMNNYYQPIRVSDYSISENGVTVNVTQVGYGVAKAFKCDPSTNYSISFKAKSEGISKELFALGYYDGDGNILSYQSYTTSSVNFTTPSDCHWVTLLFRPEANVKATYSDIMLVRGSTAMDYKPYVGKLGQINIPNAPLRLEGDNGIHDTLTFEEQTDGTYNAIVTKKVGVETPTTETIATGLSFDDTIFKIEKGGSIKAIYEEVPPTISVNFMTKSE